MGKRKKVAVFVSNIYGMMINEMQAGITEAALKEDVKLIYFASFSDSFSRKVYNQYEKYDEGDIAPFKIPDLEDFDGVILVTTSFPVDYKERIDRLLQDTGKPVINLGGEDERYYNIVNDEEASFSKVVDHVITEHGCRDIFHVAGDDKHYFTYRRIEAYKNVLEKHGIPFSDDKVYFGNLWMSCGEEAVNYILESYKDKDKKYPDAIVCANDFTAVGVVDALRERHIKVPEDIIVTGYDGVESALLGHPSITTSAQPFYEVGRESIYALKRYWNGEKLDKVTCIEAKMICNQSCGCIPMDKDSTEEIRQVYNEKMGRMEYLTQSTTNMILSMSNAENIEDCFREVARNAKIDTGFKDFLLCLSPDWDKQKVINDYVDINNEKMLVVAGFRGDKEVPWQTFNLKDILPEDMLADPNPYYVFSIHHLQYFMGYIIVSPELSHFNQLIMKSWLVNLGSMLENWRIRRKLKVTVDTLENLYNRDMLTGLYNRRGYEKFFEEIFIQCSRDNTNIAVFVIDMDDLKYVNDHYGHNEGDYSLCTISEAMSRVSSNGEICLRTGGDEFVVLAADYSEEKAKLFVERLRDCIRTRVKRDKKPYNLEVSVGLCLSKPIYHEGSTLNEVSEEYMRKADEEMYKEKKEHKKNSEYSD